MASDIRVVQIIEMGLCMWIFPLTQPLSIMLEIVSQFMRILFADTMKWLKWLLTKIVLRKSYHTKQMKFGKLL